MTLKRGTGELFDEKKLVSMHAVAIDLMQRTDAGLQKPHQFSL